MTIRLEPWQTEGILISLLCEQALAKQPLKEDSTSRVNMESNELACVCLGLPPDGFPYDALNTRACAVPTLLAHQAAAPDAAVCPWLMRARPYPDNTQK